MNELTYKELNSKKEKGEIHNHIYDGYGVEGWVEDDTIFVECEYINPENEQHLLDGWLPKDMYEEEQVKLIMTDTRKKGYRWKSELISELSLDIEADSEEEAIEIFKKSLIEFLKKHESNSQMPTIDNIDIEVTPDDYKEGMYYIDYYGSW